MPLIYHPAAEAELLEAVRFYEEKVPSLGLDFLEKIDLAITSIESDPERNRLIEKEVRRYLLPRFPFAIYYRMLPEYVRILAIKHHSRHPDYWRDRLSD
ncbi:MAG: type II toxin-antitoxin system RelE/ParE family toxin [Verrucomicrobiota bacterium]